MRLNQDYIVITDIGSTTTKAVLLDNRSEIPYLLGITHAPTTVEAPLNDVRHGIRASVEELERLHQIPLLFKSTDPVQLSWQEKVAYFSTSSAGGGLQILVIGLTLFDSASSGKRCAYGAGGVILDTFAIDDKRQAMEQMLAMRNLHPDMILLCGGTDGGAISGVLRMAEIVRIADPAPKFATSDKIPALYAGNVDAAPIIKKLISEAFDLYILPNLRPSLTVENLQPTQDKIQQLFMENVMEHAPGYSEVKPVVHAPIIPTPVGVQKALAILAGEDKRNIFAFDIGGATTDVFSYINSHFQRTVSANLGMSYSAWNVLKESGPERIMRWLPGGIEEPTVRNYIANKCLHPTANPVSTLDFRIEHALAREALSLALEQHRQMHYNGSKMGYLDKLKQGDIDKYEQIFEYQREERKYSFSESEIDVLIGAGGIFAHAQNHAQCAQILIDALRPKGITEIWIDPRFICPHLGVLSDSALQASSFLLQSEGIEKLALHIAPSFAPKSKKTVMQVEVATTRGKQLLEIAPDAFYHLPAGEKTLRVTLLSSARLNTALNLQELQTALPVLIDTRLEPSVRMNEVEQLLQLYPQDGQAAGRAFTAMSPPESKSGMWLRNVELPYSGDINYRVGEQVKPDDVVAVNRFNPPRLYIVNGFQNFPAITPQQIQDALLVHRGDRLDFDQHYAQLPATVEVPHYNRASRRLISPVRGVVEMIDPNTGIMVLSEIQDYSSRPLRVNYAELLLLKPKQARRYLLRQQGDFVYHGEMLARRLEKTSDGDPPVFVKAPGTGTITEIDTENGVLTIVYRHQPLEFQAHVNGRIESVVPSRSVQISYSGLRIEGRIAFGRECHGPFILLQNQAELASADVNGKIAALVFPPSAPNLKTLAASGAKGVVAYAMDASELVEFLGFEPGVINTGNESLSLAILLLGGFGTDALPASVANQMANRVNCYLNPHTRIRAGVVRPYLSF